MQECGTSTGNDSMVKRVTVRSGGAGHAHSGIVNTSVASKPDTAATTAAKGKMVRLGR